MKKDNIVNKIIRFIQTYLVVAFPLVLLCMARKPTPPVENNFLWEILSWNLMLWFAVLVVFLVMLVILPAARERTLCRLANLKERDEREEYITGKAARASYIATLSMMILFLFFSIFSFSYYRLPENEATNGKRTTISVSAGFNLLGDNQLVYSPETEMIFSTKSYSLSSAAMLFILIGWQLAVFNLVARRETR
jgi:heme/copper-type cytochrome/quinol oxidase subunit 2